MEIRTIRKMVENSATQFPEAVAYQIKREGEFQRFSYKDVFGKVGGLQKKLMALGVGKGDRVALLSENRPEWPMAYLAIAGMGAVVVPLDAMFKKEEVLPLLEDAEPKVFIISRKFIDYSKGTRLEGKEIIMEDFPALPSVAALLEATVAPDDLAAIVYTSGTTGSPKGVMLTNNNIISNAMTGVTCFDIGPNDNFLSVLPLHHMFETTGGFLAPYCAGCRVTYAESLKSYHILQLMQETGVTIMCGVPLLYQLFYDGIMREVEEKGKKKLFDSLLKTSRFFKQYIGVNVGKVLFSMVQKKFGGKIRFFVSGGAAIDPELIRNFELMGFTLIQGYGLTESSPVITICTPKANRLGSAGRAVPDVKVKIMGEDPVGEIIATGPNIMKGYYKRQELTDKVIIDGWLWTGDIGYLDEDGYLFITGRSKDIIVTGAGVNVYPEELEPLLKKIPAIKEACILGEKVEEGVRRGTEEVIAVIHPDYEYFEKLGKNTDEEFIKKSINEEIKTFNAKVADFKRIARFIIREEEFPKTRILKIKRFELKKELGI